MTPWARWTEICRQPAFAYGKTRTARWDRFGRPQTMPKYGLAAFPAIWWWDAQKAAKVPRT